MAKRFKYRVHAEIEDLDPSVVEGESDGLVLITLEPEERHEGEEGGDPTRGHCIIGTGQLGVCHAIVTLFSVLEKFSPETAAGLLSVILMGQRISLDDVRTVEGLPSTIEGEGR